MSSSISSTYNGVEILSSKIIDASTRISSRVLTRSLLDDSGNELELSKLNSATGVARL